MTYLNNINDTRLIIDGIDYSVVALANTIEIQPACELFSS
jgi:hypothetical protein